MEKASRMQLKNIRRLLKEKKVRDFEGLFVAEGEKITSDMLHKGHPLDAVFVSSSYAKDNEKEEFLLDIEKRGISVFKIGDAEFDRISALQHSQGILCVAKKPEYPKSPLPGGKEGFIVLCDGIQDPGNLGTIIRTSAAMGADLVMLAGECADVFNPKVVRASSGMVLDIAVSECDEKALERLKNEGYYFLVSRVTKEKSKDIAQIRDLPPRFVVAFGSEGQGVSEKVLERADQSFYIPVLEKVESLNVTSAVAITLYALARIRRGAETEQ